MSLLGPFDKRTVTLSREIKTPNVGEVYDTLFSWLADQDNPVPRHAKLELDDGLYGAALIATWSE